MAPHSPVPYPLIRNAASKAGLTLLGVTDASPLVGEEEHLSRWQKAGFAGEMGYMKRDPAMLIGTEHVLPGACSIISLAANYSTGTPPPLPAGHGRIARYAWGKDYHILLRERLDTFIREISAAIDEVVTARRFTDSVPLLERALAHRSGGGFTGKNTMLIRPGEGSFFFLAEILWEREVSEIPEKPPVRGRCGSCTQCLSGCPTGALVSPRVMDARRCISYLTIEKGGMFYEWEREAIGEWLFGCDICQDLCPFNHSAQKVERPVIIGELSRDQGAGPSLSIADLLKIDDDAAFRKRFAKTPLLRAKRPGLLRNACAVAVNRTIEGVWLQLVERAENDASPVVRAHALWAACALRARCNNAPMHVITALIQRRMADPSPEVQREAAACVQFIEMQR